MQLREVLKQKRSLGCFWLSLGSVPLAEFSADAGTDAVVFDGQHGLWERNNLENAIGIVKDKTIPIVRVADCSRFNISAALDAGAEGVIIPLIETMDQARQAINWARFPPLGSRSGGGVRPLKDFPAYKKQADKNTMVALMIETATGLDNLDDILSVDQIDMIFIGTGDLSLSMGVDVGDPKFEDVIQIIKENCVKSGIPAGIFTGNTEQAIRRQNEGFQLVVIGDDISLSRKMINGCVTVFAKK